MHLSLLAHFLWKRMEFAYSQRAPAAAAAAKSLQSRPTLCDSIDGSPPGSAVPGILQARTLEWVAISFSNAWKWKVKVKSLSRVRLLATPWTAAYQAPPSTGFSRQECWSGVPLPSLTLRKFERKKVKKSLTLPIYYLTGNKLATLQVKKWGWMRLSTALSHTARKW